MEGTSSWVFVKEEGVWRGGEGEGFSEQDMGSSWGASSSHADPASGSQAASGIQAEGLAGSMSPRAAAEEDEPVGIAAESVVALQPAREETVEVASEAAGAEAAADAGRGLAKWAYDIIEMVSERIRSVAGWSVRRTSEIRPVS